jgi:hypothetical protein
MWGIFSFVSFLTKQLPCAIVLLIVIVGIVKIDIHCQHAVVVRLPMEKNDDSKYSTDDDVEWKWLGDPVTAMQ